MTDPTGKYGPYGSQAAFLFHELIRQVMPSGQGRREFRKGECIFEEGKQANGLFCILSGKVKVSKITDSGKEQIFRLAGVRDVVGYRALFGNRPYKASAIALEDTTVGYVPKKIFFDILNSSPEMAMQMMQMLSRELEKSEERQITIATKTVRERLAEALLLLRETYGLQQDGLTLDIALSREELAGMVGAAKEVVIRSLAQFKDEGYIDTKGRRILILKQSDLLRAANS